VQQVQAAVRNFQETLRKKCGHVIGSKLNQLPWHSFGEGLKMIFIAGNELFNQGSVDYEVSRRYGDPVR
jgi:hypothetical protein